MLNSSLRMMYNNDHRKIICHLFFPAKWLRLVEVPLESWFFDWQHWYFRVFSWKKLPPDSTYMCIKIYIYIYNYIYIYCICKSSRFDIWMDRHSSQKVGFGRDRSDSSQSQYHWPCPFCQLASCLLEVWLVARLMVPHAKAIGNEVGGRWPPANKEGAVTMVMPQVPLKVEWKHQLGLGMFLQYLT